MAEKTRFRVIAGKHFEMGQGIDPHSGDPALVPIVSDAGDPNNNVVESTRPLDKIFPNKFQRIVDVAPPKRDVSDERRAATSVAIESGRFAEEDRDFLEQLPDDRFGRVTGITPAAKEGEPPPLGEDVTKDFKGLPGGYQVWRNAAGKHQITKGSDTARPVNKDALDHDRVLKFAQDHSKGKA